MQPEALRWRPVDASNSGITDPVCIRFEQLFRNFDFGFSGELTKSIIKFSLSYRFDQNRLQMDKMSCQIVDETSAVKSVTTASYGDVLSRQLLLLFGGWTFSYFVRAEPKVQLLLSRRLSQEKWEVPKLLQEGLDTLSHFHRLNLSREEISTYLFSRTT